VRMQITYDSLTDALIRNMADSLGTSQTTFFDEDLDRMKRVIESGIVQSHPEVTGSVP
jgi:hypothetical protein